MFVSLGFVVCNICLFRVGYVTILYVQINYYTYVGKEWSPVGQEDPPSQGEVHGGRACPRHWTCPSSPPPGWSAQPCPELTLPTCPSHKGWQQLFKPFFWYFMRYSLLSMIEFLALFFFSHWYSKLLWLIPCVCYPYPVFTEGINVIIWSIHAKQILTPSVS